jgi:urea carboxylase
MEGPGGYQFVGRTVQMWNRWRQTGDFTEGRRWLLRFFDQLRFYPVGSEELLQMREDFPLGRFQLRIESTSLRLTDYRRFLAQNDASIASFRQCQQAAFAAERQRWRDAGLPETPAQETAPERATADLPAGSDPVYAPVTGSLWQLHVQAGQEVAADQELLVMEAMKMEISVRAENAGVVAAVFCEPGKPAQAGDVLLAIRPAGESA